MSPLPPTPPGTCRVKTGTCSVKTAHTYIHRKRNCAPSAKQQGILFPCPYFDQVQGETYVVYKKHLVCIGFDGCLKASNYLLWPLRCRKTKKWIIQMVTNTLWNICEKACQEIETIIENCWDIVSFCRTFCFKNISKYFW